MKNTKSLLLFILSIFLFSCENELNLISEWKDIPIVYGKISVSDTAHYVRIEKAFLDPDTDATILASNPDSVYYDDIVVELVRLSDNYSVQLKKVDGNLEGYVREDGNFPQSPNYLYKVKANQFPLEGGEPIELRITRSEDLPVVTATTEALPRMDYLQSRPPSTIFTWNEFIPVKVSWKPKSENAVIFDLNIIMHYRETNTDFPGEIFNKNLNWQVVNNFQREGTSEAVTYEVFGDQFYQYVGSHIEAGSKYRRALQFLEFSVTGGGPEIRDFVQLTLANTGITSSQDPPVYTNLSNGFGIFTAVSEANTSGITLGLDARDSLVSGRFTRELNFE